MFALIDANNFFVSCERVFQPELSNKPVIVLSNNDGCAIARSNEAKILGIKMGEPFHTIGDVIESFKVHVRSANFTLYGDMSSRLMAVIKRESPNIEVYSIDESFVQIGNYADQENWAINLRATILKETGLPTSIGIARTKVLSKLANRLAKKSGGFFILHNENEARVLAATPVGDLWGVGKQISNSLMVNGIYTALQLAQAERNFIRDRYSIVLSRIQAELLGESTLALEEHTPKRKEVLVSRSFGQPITSREQISLAITKFIEDGSKRLRKQNSEARLLTVFIKTNRFSKKAQQYSNAIQIKLPCSSSETALLNHYAQLIAIRLFRSGYEYKKAGIRLSELTEVGSHQNDLFVGSRSLASDAVKDSINARYGNASIKPASMVSGQQDWHMKRNHLSKSYTTKWDDIPIAS